MNITSKLTIALFLTAGLCAGVAQAAPRDNAKGDNGAVLKLQAMVKSLTTERDTAKTETAKLSGELEQLKKDHSKALASAEAAKDQLGSELAAQKNSTNDARDHLDKTNTKLQEAVDKIRQLTQTKNELSSELTNLKNTQQATQQQLTSCTEHNIKLYQSGKELLEQYETKGTLSSMLQSEPALQFHSVEMENIIQEYEDKLKAGQYKN
ncbi:hypothetical protein KEF85_07410 [Methylomonas paludis]|uniref:Chromosome partition protein Smc n=1 Tax=Methylomonas paludis TaxID=1173101 RepID=A0A975MRN5_9GAMM|nr:hypothetical protein [Methylomonas paludis]QWF72264.1 hypothetical protein KEF85_07410 [Methylomonas paludis]